MNSSVERQKRNSPNDCKRQAKGSSPKRQCMSTIAKAEPLRLLLVDNSVHDELSIINELHCGGFEVSHKRVEGPEDFRMELGRQTWDLIICDYCLRESDGATVLELHQQSGLDIPFIMVSATIGEDLAVEALKAGANEYVMKQNLTRLVPAINRELRAAQERQIRRRTESAQAYLASVVQSCNDAIIGETLDGITVAWNRGAERLYGYAASEMIGRPVSILTPRYRPESTYDCLEAFSPGKPVQDLVTVHIRKDGSEVEVALSISPIKDAAERIIEVREGKAEVFSVHLTAQATKAATHKNKFGEDYPPQPAQTY